jgi:nucleotide-binding universal stress UspA family protein
MYSKILVPLDGSRTAENALPLARSFARALQAPVELLAIVDVGETARQAAADSIWITPNFMEQASRALGEYLDRVAKHFPAGGVQCNVKSGNAAETIIAAADPSTLIAMATHGRSGLDRWLLGSVTEKVLRGASNPLVVVRAEENISPAWEKGSVKRVIVPLDGSELAEGGLAHVDALARHLDLEVVLLAVYDIPGAARTAGEGFFTDAQLGQLRAELRAETVSYLNTKAEEMKSRGLKKISLMAREGLAADEIIAAARQNGDTLLAMSTHGRSGVKRWILGSVTETVVRHSDCPVLVMRAA